MLNMYHGKSAVLVLYLKLTGIEATCIASGSLVPRVEGGSGDETTPVVTGDDLM